MARKKNTPVNQNKAADDALNELVALEQELGLDKIIDNPLIKPETPPTPSTNATESNTTTFAELANTLGTPNTDSVSNSDTKAPIEYEEHLEYPALDGRISFVIENPDLHRFTDAILKASRYGAELIPNTVPLLFGVPKLAAVSIPEELFKDFLKEYSNYELSKTGNAFAGSGLKLIIISSYDPIEYVNHLLHFGSLGGVIATDTVATDAIGNLTYGFSPTVNLVVPEETVEGIQNPYIQVIQ